MDPLKGSMIYTIGVLESRIAGSIFGSSQGSGLGGDVIRGLCSLGFRLN